MFFPPQSWTLVRPLLSMDLFRLSWLALFILVKKKKKICREPHFLGGFLGNWKSEILRIWMTLTETQETSPLKIHGWKMNLLFETAYILSGAMLEVVFQRSRKLTRGCILVTYVWACPSNAKNLF